MDRYLDLRDEDVGRARKHLRMYAWQWLREAGYAAPTWHQLQSKHPFKNVWAKYGKLAPEIEACLWETYASTNGDYDKTRDVILTTAALIGFPRSGDDGISLTSISHP